MSLIFNHSKPMFSPNLKEVHNYIPLSEIERMTVLAEIDLMDTCKQWSTNEDAKCEDYKELAMIYASTYDDKIAMSNLLLTFQGAVVQMQVDINKHVAIKGENSKTIEAYKRNQMFMRVHRESSAMIERNQQMMLMLKNSLEKYMQISDENKKLKEENEAVKKAWESA